MQEEWAIYRIEIDGMIMGDREMASGSKIDIPFGNVLLGAGNHTLRVIMTNDFNVPLLGDRNLYVATVMLSLYYLCERLWAANPALLFTVLLHTSSSKSLDALIL